MTTATENISAVALTSRFSDVELSEFKTHEQALELLQSLGTVVEDFSEYGSGFDLVDKDTLVGVPMMIVEWKMIRSDKVVEGGQFVAVSAITSDDKKVVFVDGGTGVMEQLAHVSLSREEKGVPVEGRNRGLIARKGLRSSSYQVADNKGKMMNATTFYIA